MIVASIRTASAVPSPDLLDEDDLRGHEGADRDREQERGRGDDPAGALEPDRDRLGVGGAAVARLLDPREQEDAVVGREPEGDREQEERLRRLERRPGSCSRAGPRSRPSWKIRTRIPNTALRPSRFISSCFSGSTTEPVIRKRTTKVATATIASISGRCSTRLSWRSTKPAVEAGRPATSARRAPRSSLDQVLARVVERRRPRRSPRPRQTSSSSGCGG